MFKFELFGSIPPKNRNVKWKRFKFEQNVFHRRAGAQCRETYLFSGGQCGSLFTQRARARRKPSFAPRPWVNLLFEECHGHSAGTGVGADYAANGRITDFRQIAFPEMSAVMDVLEKHRIGKTRIAQQHRL